MSGPLDISAPTPLMYFASLVADDDSLPVLEAAAAVAQDENSRLDVQAVLAEVDALAATLRRRIADDLGPMQRLILLNRYFFGELGFAGNVNDYYDPRNSYLSDVLARRRGIPLTLALIYIEVAGQMGLDAAGVGFPGHFLIKLQMPQGEVVIDPFNGESLSRAALDERLQPFLAAQGRPGTDEATLAHALRVTPPRAVIARLLHNLKAIHRSAADIPRQLAVLDRLVILLPEAWEERRDRGLVQAQLGRPDLARDDVAQYLLHRPDATDAPALRLRLNGWRTAGSGRLH